MDLQPLSADLQRRFDEKMVAREAALAASRRAIRASANAIRAIHRAELDEAHRLLDQAAEAVAEAGRATEAHPDVRYAGFVHDAQKEYTEGRLTEAVIQGQDLPTADDLGVTPAAYLNGMADTIGEGRRAVLDHLRHGEVDRGEELLRAMEELYYVLATMDYPDAITGNLRRATDVGRSIIEKTRGDLSVAIVQRSLRDALERHAQDLRGDG